MSITFEPQDRRNAMTGIGAGIAQYYKDKEDNNKRRQALEMKGAETVQELSKKYNVDPEAGIGLVDAYGRGDASAISQILGEIKKSDYTNEYAVKNKREKELLDANLQYKQAQTGKLVSEFSDYGKPYLSTKAGKEFVAKENYKAGMKRTEKQGVDPKQRLAGLSAEAQNKVASIASGIRALSGMKRSMENPINPIGPQYIDVNTPGIGMFKSDTPYTKNQRVLDEVVGRLQSGGAIQKEELTTFRNMGPRPGDSPEIQKEKLLDQVAFLENKANAFGFNIDEMKQAGFDIGDIKRTNATPIQRQSGELRDSKFGMTIKEIDAMLGL